MTLDHATSTPARDGLVRSPWFWAAVLVGAALRLAGLFRQVLVADEVHAYRHALLLDLPQALVAYPFTANSPPLNAWLRLLVELGVPPGELALRLPVALCGLALLVLAPLWTARHVGRFEALLLAWLLAISPHFVYHSRFLRPYIGFALLTAVAVAAFWDWWRTGRTASGILYAVAAAAATYLHLLAAPFVAAPALFLVLERVLSGRPAWPPWRRLLGVGALAAGLVLLFVVPAWPHLHKLASARRQAIAADGEDAVHALIVLSGSGRRWMVALFWVAVVAGIVRLARRDGALSRFLLVPTVTLAVAVPLLSPTFINNPMILARYLLPVLLPLLLLVAVALAPRRGTGVLARAPAALFVVASFWTGPLTDPALYRDSLGLRPELLALHQLDKRPTWPLPPPYEILADGAPGALLEFPVRAMQRFFNPLSDYQRLHRRRVRVSPGDQLLSDARLGLETILPGEPEAFLAADAAWLAVHRDWHRELGPDLGFQGPYSRESYERMAAILDRLNRVGRAMARELTARWGPPDARDSIVSLWDLDRVRRELAAGGARGALGPPVASFPGDGTRGVLAWELEGDIASVLREYVFGAEVAEWQVADFAIRSLDLLEQAGDRLAAYGVTSSGNGEGRWIGRVYEMAPEGLSLLWTTESLAPASRDPEVIRVSRDGRHWLVGSSDRRGNVNLSVGAIGESTPAWTLTTVPPGTAGSDVLDLAELTVLPDGRNAVVLGWKGALFHAAIGATSLNRLAVPPSCGAVRMFEVADGRLWGTCSGEVTAVSDGSGSKEIVDWLRVAARAPSRYVAYVLTAGEEAAPPLSVDSRALGTSASTELHALSDGTALLLDRESETVTRVRLESGAIVVGPAGPVPADVVWANGAFVRFPHGVEAGPEVIPSDDLF